jgi:hypothetical protein
MAVSTMVYVPGGVVNEAPPPELEPPPHDTKPDTAIAERASSESIPRQLEDRRRRNMRIIAGTTATKPRPERTIEPEACWAEADTPVATLTATLAWLPAVNVTDEGEEEQILTLRPMRSSSVL